MFTSIRPLRLTLPAALLALSSLTVLSASHAQAQTTTIQHPYAIGLNRAKAKPYNYTGRLFDTDTISFGSGTLVRRHTILTAAHVLYSPSTGFGTGITFTRALYANYFLSRSQVAVTNVLSGYQGLALEAGDGFESIASGARDLGYVLTLDAPKDNDWGTYFPNTSALTDDSGRFVLGYPGVTFNGRTMCYTVPMTPFVQVGAVGSGLFQNEEFITEPGNSGGPVYSLQNNQQVIVGELVAGIDDSSGEFNASFIRALDTEADQFLTAAEYTSNLITGVRFKGPKTALRGTTVVYKLSTLFAVRAAFDGLASTTRYKELALQTDNAGTLSQPGITIKKINNKKFAVTYSSRLRPNTIVTLQAGYAVPVTATGTLAPGTTADNITAIQGATFQVTIQ